MAGPNLTSHGPITFVQSVSQKGPFSLAWPEKASQQFLPGTPLQPYNSTTATLPHNSEFVQAWDGSTYTAAIWGFSYSFGLNLATNGVGAPVQFGPVTGTKATATFGSVINQPAAANIAVGTPASDGRTYFMQALPDTVFQAVFDDAAGTTSANYTPNSNLMGSLLGLTQDSTGYWYLDGNVTSGNLAICEIVGQDPDYGFGNVNGILRFKIIASAQFML
jgi:hypothetical protein